MLRGNFPLIVTTNWDMLFEDLSHLQPDNNRRAVDSQGRSIRVRYRQDIPQLFGELTRLSEYEAAPLLLKIHGDFSEKGRREFVAGHASYRSMKTSNAAARDMLRYLATRFSFLFYGTSLTDSDLLAILDDCMEVFGSNAGTHFWLTADEVSDARTRFLNEHYNVQTIRISGRNKFQRLESLLGDVCQCGSRLSRGISMLDAGFSISTMVRLKICSKVLPLSVLEERVPPADASVGLSIPLVPLTGEFVDVRGRMGRMLHAFVGFSDANLQAYLAQTRGFSRESGGQHWRCIPLEHVDREADGTCRSSFWIIMADAESYDRDSAREAKHQRAMEQRVKDLHVAVADATRHFLLAATRHECDLKKAKLASPSLLASVFGAGANRKSPQVSDVRLVLPLLGTGLLQLGERSALRTMLSAIMGARKQLEGIVQDVFSDVSTRLPRVRIEICLPSQSPILHEISMGAFSVGSILSAAASQNASFRASVTGPDGAILRTQQVLGSPSWTFRDLRATLGLDPDEDTLVGGVGRIHAPDDLLRDTQFFLEGASVRICHQSRLQEYRRKTEIIDGETYTLALRKRMLVVWKNSASDTFELALAPQKPTAWTARDYRKLAKRRAGKGGWAACCQWELRAVGGDGEFLITPSSFSALPGVSVGDDAANEAAAALNDDLDRMRLVLTLQRDAERNPILRLAPTAEPPPEEDSDAETKGTPSAREAASWAFVAKFDGGFEIQNRAAELALSIASGHETVVCHKMNSTAQFWAIARGKTDLVPWI